MCLELITIRIGQIRIGMPKMPIFTVSGKMMRICIRIRIHNTLLKFRSGFGLIPDAQRCL
jgi:hypothetical protein